MKERHTMSLNCFTSFSFLTPISLINLLLQQWVKEIVSLSFFSARPDGRDHENECPALCQMQDLSYIATQARCCPGWLKTVQCNFPPCVRIKVLQVAGHRARRKKKKKKICFEDDLGL